MIPLQDFGAIIRGRYVGPLSSDALDESLRKKNWVHLSPRPMKLVLSLISILFAAVGRVADDDATKFDQRKLIEDYLPRVRCMLQDVA